MEFSYTRLVGKKQNDNFYFPYLSSFSDLFWLEMNHNHIFLFFIFWIFYYFYGIFYYASGRNGTEWNDDFCLSLSHLFPTYFGLKWILNGIFEFLNFFVIFLEFSITHQAGMKQNNNFYFLSFSASPNLFWLEMRQ